MDDETRNEIQRLQEAQGYTDHHVEQLDEQVRRSFERLRALSARLDNLEGRLATLASAGDVRLDNAIGEDDADGPEFERPPHSSRGRRDDE